MPGWAWEAALSAEYLVTVVVALVVGALLGTGAPRAALAARHPPLRCSPRRAAASRALQ
jgi:hypothetical protein